MIAMLGHGDGVDAHMGTGSIWMALSMVAFALFLLVFAWSLLRPAKQRPPTAADIAAERFAGGEISTEDFARIVDDATSRSR